MRRVALIVLLVLLCTASHYLVPHDRHELHQFLFKVTYVPIILAALWFGARGGLVTSVLVSILYLAHIEYQLGGQLLTTNLGWTLDVVLYNGIALVTGGLSQAQARARLQAERLAQEQSALRKQLQASYETLREQTAELLETTEQLQRAGRLAALGELTASIAHEIRNPLSGISGAAEIVCRESAPPNVRAEFGDILQKETTRLNQVVQNILNFARVQKAEARETELPDIVRRLATLVAKEAQEHKITIVQDIPSEIRAQTAPALLEHVLLNLMLNAIQAMPNGGTLTLSARTADDLLRLSVRDTGPGIPAETQAQLFSPFFTTKPGGTGLGLAIARRIARGMGGDVSLNSQLGSGAEFVVEIPLRPSPIPASGLFDGKRIDHEPENPAG